MSKKWIKVFFRGGDRIPSVEWISGSFKNVKRIAYEEMAEIAYLDLEDDGVSDLRNAFLKELRTRENDDCLFLKFKHGYHPRSDMVIMSKTSLEKTVPMVSISGRKLWIFVWVDDNASFEAGECVLRIAKGSKSAIKNIVTDKVNRPAPYRRETKFSVKEIYHPDGFIGYSEDVMDHICYGEGLKVAAIPFAEIPDHKDPEFI